MMNYLAQQENGIIANNTEFYYFENGLPTAAGTNYKAYKFTYNNGALTKTTDAVTVVVEVSGETKTYKIDSAEVTFTATDNTKVYIKTVTP